MLKRHKTLSGVNDDKRSQARQSNLKVAIVKNAATKWYVCEVVKKLKFHLNNIKPLSPKKRMLNKITKITIYNDVKSYRR